MNLIKWHGNREGRSKVWFIVLHTGVCFHVLLLQLGKACDGFWDIWWDKQNERIWLLIWGLHALMQHANPLFYCVMGPESYYTSLVFQSHSVFPPIALLCHASLCLEWAVERKLMFDIVTFYCWIFTVAVAQYMCGLLFFEWNSVSCFCPFVT